ncbi:tRNA dimethylallyltransferase [Devosia pacifica]|uniref:tRNA dimethylallyltransferase n=1 Tax=Devosia pacifica TaxID=1335967 RepID=A0A918RXU4_9HYPH|nr:tRNA (adenosine(37)-N6)-dimethylallyltransferase MiaA [Devosia pacifica]GHA15710.1 tRNA dimethylallyltransferase [Devosia pacifica]
MRNELSRMIDAAAANGRRTAVLIAGPTASGKSGLAHALARAVDGVVINTDALQVYDTLRVVTARPSADEIQDVPYRLYGFVDCAEAFSTGKWLANARQVIAESDRKILFFVGGTGLYFDALINGFADIPQVAATVRAEVRSRIAGLDAEQRLALLQVEDPEAALRLKVVDPQRLERALSVKAATGRMLSSFQQQPETGALVGIETVRVVLDPDREVLRQRIANRFEEMFTNGAVDEVRNLLERKLDPSLPAMKAIGVPEISAWLHGDIIQETAIERAVIATRQYAKRQRTWFRNRFSDWVRLPS